MTYTFKLSRRLARIRDTALAVAVIGAISCTDDGISGPDSNAIPNDLGTVTLSPDSTAVGVNQSVQFEALIGSRQLPYQSGNGFSPRFGRVQRVVVQPTSSNVAPGGSLKFSATATVRGAWGAKPTLTWTATGGRVDAFGRYTAGTVPGHYRIIAAASKTVADTAAITISSTAPVVSKVVLSPTGTSLAPGEGQQFTLTGRTQDGSTTPVSPKYTASGGTMAEDGSYKAGATPGKYRVIATDATTNLADTSDVTITAPGVTLQSVVLNPPSASVAGGAKQQFTASGKMSDGSTTPLSALFTATGGSITSTGEYSAGNTAGSYRVIATDEESGKADTAAVTVTASTPAPPPTPTLTSIVVSPTSTSLNSGDTKQFTASGKMSDGSNSSVPVTWSETGGTISSSGMYTAGGSAGTFRVVAVESGGTLADTAVVTIMVPAPPPPPTSSVGCPSAGYTRLVNVSTQSQLTAALNAALPGDQIRLGAGTYSGGFTIAASRDGTAQDPITLCGPRTAIISGSPTHYGNYWVFSGFRVTNLGYAGWFFRGAAFNVVDGIEIDHSQQELLVLADASHDNIVRNSSFHDSGLAGNAYAEGIYVGNGSTNSDPANNNSLISNHLGPNIRSEHIDIKQGTSGTIVQGNVSDAAGFVFRSGMTDAIYITGGSNVQFLDNQVTNISSPSAEGMMNWQGSNNQWRRNKLSGSFHNGFSISGGSGNKVYCDNVVSGAAFGVTCQ